jgi:hypothetical protein
MGEISRRTFLNVSAGGIALLADPVGALAQATCSTLPPFLPNRVTVDCATRLNFRLFRQNTSYLGLAGVVNMTAARGKYGTYQAGSLMLFPYLKPKGRTLNRVWASVLPANATQTVAMGPMSYPLPPDEYFCTLLGAPQNQFIGFLVDVPYAIDDARRAWFSNVSIASKESVGIDWTSANLNHTWFGGSRFIPQTAACNGATWRKLIADGLQQAAVGACA